MHFLICLLSFKKKTNTSIIVSSALNFYLVLTLICINKIFVPFQIEALIMMLFYVGYCVALIFNSSIEKWALATLPGLLPINLPNKDEQSSLVTFKNLPDTSYTQEQSNLPDQDQSVQQSLPQETNYDANSSWDPNAAWGEQPVAAAPVMPTNSWGDGQQNYGYNAAGEWGDSNEQTEPESGTNETKPPQQQQSGSGIVGKVQPDQQPTNYYKPKEQKPEDLKVNPLEKPNGMPAQISWAIMYPIHYMCRLTSM
jgi:solute carrier family 24 (sodium/potassium/calcium exchanger), member 4